MQKISLIQIQKLFFIFLPFSFIVGNFVFNLNTILIDLFFLILIRRDVDYSRLFLKLKTKKNINFFIVIFLLLLANIFFSDNIFNSVKGFLGIIKNLILIFALAFFLKDTENFNIFLKLYTFLIFFLILDLIIQYHTGKDIFGYEWFVDNNYRLSGFFNDEYVAGSYLSKNIFFIFLNIGIFFNKKIENIIKLLYLLIAIVILFFIGERSSIIITTFTSFIYLLINFDEYKKRFTFLSIFSLVILLSTYVISKNFSEKNIFLKTKEQFKIENISDASEIFEKTYDSVYFDLFKTSIEIYKNNKIIGSGLRTFRNSCDKVKIAKISGVTQGTCGTHPHNLYLEILSELGIILFIIFILFHLLVLLKIFLSISQNKSFLLPLFALGIILFFPFQTTGSYFSSWNSFFYVVFYSLTLSYSMKKNLKWSK